MPFPLEVSRYTEPEPTAARAELNERQWLLASLDGAPGQPSKNPPERAKLSREERDRVEIPVGACLFRGIHFAPIEVLERSFTFLAEVAGARISLSPAEVHFYRNSTEVPPERSLRGAPNVSDNYFNHIRLQHCHRGLGGKNRSRVRQLLRGFDSATERVPDTGATEGLLPTQKDS